MLRKFCKAVEGVASGQQQAERTYHAGDSRGQCGDAQRALYRLDLAPDADRSRISEDGMGKIQDFAHFSFHWRRRSGTGFAGRSRNPLRFTQKKRGFGLVFRQIAKT